MKNKIKDLETVASFMILSLAFSTVAFAGVDGVSATNTMNSANNNMFYSLYGIPTKPIVNPNPPVNELYGIPTKPIVNPNPPVNILYGIPTKPDVNPNPPVNILYGIPTKPDINPNPPVNVLYGIPTNTINEVGEVNNHYNILPTKNTDNIPNKLEKVMSKNKGAKDNDTATPANYVAPVILPYVIDNVE